MNRMMQAVAGLAAAALAAPAMAQQGSDQFPQGALDFERGRVTGYDLDNDGVVDAWYTVSQYDLEREQLRRNARQDQPFQQRMQGERQGRQHTLHGTITDARRVQLPGQRERHTLAKLTLQNGRTAIVNLGPRATPGSLNLSKGDQVTIRGERVTLDNRPLLLANTVTVDGQTTTIRRAGASRRASGFGQGQFGQGQFGQQQFGQDQFGQGRFQQHQRVLGMMGSGGQAEQIIQNWPDASKKAAHEMIQKYGQPDSATRDMLVWKNNGPWKETVVYSESIQHNFPVPHQDVLEQTINFDVPEDKFDELARFDGSLIAERTNGELSSRCDSEGANTATLNLAHQLIEGQLSVDEARRQMAESIQAHMQGNTPRIMTALQFNPPNRDITNPGERAIRQRGGQ